MKFCSFLKLLIVTNIYCKFNFESDLFQEESYRYCFQLFYDNLYQKYGWYQEYAIVDTSFWISFLVILINYFKAEQVPAQILQSNWKFYIVT